MSDIAEKCAKLQSSRQRLRNSSARERADKLNAIWAGVVERKDDIFVAGNKERGTHDLDIAAELVMIKGEIEIAIVLGIPTIGPLILSSVAERDMYVVSAIFMMVAVLLVLGNLFADLLLAFIDPRVRHATLARG